MNDRHGDGDIRRRFQELRQEDRRRQPPFADVAAAAERRGAARRLRPWAVPAGLAAALVMGLWLLGDRGGATSAEPLAIDLSTTIWTAPTDFLLELPGDDLLRRVPELETGEAWLSREGNPRNPEPSRREMRNRS